MTILALSTWCPYPTVNGSSLRAYHLLRSLATRHTVDLLTFSAPTAPDAAAVAHLREFCADVTVIPTSPFTPVPGNAATHLSATPRSLLTTWDPAVRDLVSRAAAAVDMAVGLQLSAARYLTRVAVPVVFEEAEPRQIRAQLDGARTWRERSRLRLTWWKHARYLRHLAAAMASVTVVSDDERDALVGIGIPAERVHLVPNGADAADLVRPRTVATPARIVYAGAVTYPPNLEAVRWFLTGVMPALRAARPDLEFWVTGDTGDVALDDLPNRGWATFTGRLPDVKAAVGDAAAAVVPLLAGGGTRLKVLEALALGTPTVSTTKGAEGLEVVDGRHLLLADDPRRFADQVLRVLGDPALAARLSAESRALVRQTYTWPAIGQRLLDVVDDAMERTRP
jgi:glycosyltransferase involved in cell wall biosynthesis